MREDSEPPPADAKPEMQPADMAPGDDSEPTDTPPANPGVPPAADNMVDDAPTNPNAMDGASLGSAQLGKSKVPREGVVAATADRTRWVGGRLLAVALCAACRLGGAAPHAGAPCM